ncbi:hypothetical protein [Chryseobacterium sp. JM1]|uniref:hypothetical protein n=1 Tax=Chryseobacterium sp. JM1 TaxID=1233950 RepID=UPI0004E67C5E|nr:hypothetical protein [Chryseobacterium sp. JM1]KFF15486.1 hypothetical protein IW22_24095 [Chryseobacterium sp. JM1]
MQNLKQLNIDLKTYLEKTTEQFVKGLVQILEGKNADYLNGKSKTDIVAYYFEYEYDHLDISAWTIDKSGAIITNPVLLLTQKEEENDGKESWNALLPEKIWKAASDFQEEYEDDDDRWDEYNEEKYEIFENWFFDGWKKASAQTDNKADAYFSIHDTYFKTDLNTLQTINDDEIAERYTS